MAGILRYWRIPAATLFSAALVLGAYLLAKSVETPPVVQASEETALLQAIATKDSDNDGLPDWEEALYGTDPNNPDTNHLGMTDGEAVAKGLIVPKAIADVPITASAGTKNVIDPSLPAAPADGTITAVFAKNFFNFFLTAKQQNGGGDLSESQMNEVANQALGSLSSALIAAPDFKAAKDLTLSNSGPDALKAFAVAAEAVLLKNKKDASKSEILYLQDAVQKDDATALTHIASIAKAYRDSAVGLSVLPVPAELAADDLALMNAMMRISQIATDFTSVNTDPLATILALQQYPAAVTALGTAFIHVGAIYKSAGISLTAGMPGASFVNLIENIVAEQKSAKKP